MDHYVTPDAGQPPICLLQFLYRSVLLVSKTKPHSPSPSPFTWRQRPELIAHAYKEHLPHVLFTVNHMTIILYHVWDQHRYRF